VAAALADAPDPKIPPQTPSAKVIHVTHNAAAGTTTVTVTGGWVWTTHGKDCNTDRAGVGFAVDWNDPLDPGFPVATLPDGRPVDVGSSLAVNGNSVDDVVHPTPGTAAFGGSADETDVATPSQYRSWRGGCGSFSFDDPAGGLAPEGTWGPRSHVLDAAGTDGGAQDGISHTYKDASIAQGIDICVIAYDVHGTSAKANGGVGVPGGAKEITAGGPGHNDDNGAEKNQHTPLGNACVPIHVPGFPTRTAAVATVPSVIPNDSATLTGGNDPTGTLTFELFGPNDATCSGAPAFKQTARLEHGSAATRNTTFVANDVGTWRWRLSYAGDANDLPSTSKCGLESFDVGNG
jgi:hypothetical protein